MGHVFTLEDFASGMIPATKDYADALGRLRDSLGGMHSDGLIEAAAIHGSALASPEPGADVDVIAILADHRWEHAERKLLEVKGSIRDRANVPVEFVTSIRSNAEAGFHSFDSFYVNHLRQSSSGIVGRNPVPLIGPKESWENPEQEVRERLSYHLTRFSKRASNVQRDYEGEHCRFLEKLARQPLYAAIDMLRLGNSCLMHEDGRPLTKRECIDAYAAGFPEGPLEDLYAVLNSRESYRSFLGNWEGKSLDDYQRALDRLGKIYPNAVRAVSRILASLD